MDIIPNIRENGAYSLDSDEVHVWTACLLENEEVATYFFSILSKDESEKARHFKFYKDQKQFIISRGILRCLLALYLSKNPKNIDIKYGPWGKPFLSPKQSLNFNTSHSMDYVMYALTPNYELGIDIEYINKNFDFADMAYSVFTALEETHWKVLEAEDKINLFFKYWVCKEAFLKATGKGWMQNEEVRSHQELNRAHYFESISGYASALYIMGQPCLRPQNYKWDKSILQNHSSILNYDY